MDPSLTSGLEAFLAYVEDPFSFWDGKALRQARKLDKKKRALAEQIGCAPGDVGPRVVAQARERQAAGPVYVTGLGGSGSHWLSGMLAELGGFFDAGEVYFPTALRRIFDDDPNQAPVVLDALHLLHSRSYPVVNERAVNCAAGAYRTADYLRWDPTSSVLYLVRNPRDQVLSTTFRKAEYRHEVAGRSEDAEYLVERCGISRTDRYGYLKAGIGADATVRYEDLRSSPVSELARIAAVLGVSVNDSQLARIADRFDADNIRAGKVAPTGNLFLEAEGAPWKALRWRAAVHVELIDVIESLGYSFGNCLMDPPPLKADRPGRPPAGVRLRGWTEEGWSLCGDSDGPWLAEMVEAHEDQIAWLRDSSLYGLCAARLERVSNSWLSAVLENRSLRTLDLGTVHLDADQFDLLAARGRRLTALNVWGSVDDRANVQLDTDLPWATVVA